MLRSAEPARTGGRRVRMRGRSRVLLFSASRDWHAKELAAALERRDIDVTTLRLETCSFDSASSTGLRLGKERGLPDGVLVRTVSAGSFEAVTRRLGLLHALGRLAVPVWNDAVA